MFRQCGMRTACRAAAVNGDENELQPAMRYSHWIKLRNRCDKKEERCRCITVIVTQERP